jgi:hypothetical protein
MTPGPSKTSSATWTPSKIITWSFNGDTGADRGAVLQKGSVTDVAVASDGRAGQDVANAHTRVRRPTLLLSHQSMDVQRHRLVRAKSSRHHAAVFNAHSDIALPPSSSDKSPRRAPELSATSPSISPSAPRPC